MAKKSKEDVEKEILEAQAKSKTSRGPSEQSSDWEAKEEVKEETKQEKKGALKKVKEAVKKDVAPKEEKPKEEKKKARPKKKKKLLEKARETIEEVKEAKKEGPKVKKKGISRVYNIPLRNQVPRTRRTKTAAHQLREFVQKHTNVQEVVISPEVNQLLWEKGYKKFPHHVRVFVEEDDEGRIIVKPK